MLKHGWWLVGSLLGLIVGLVGILWSVNRLYLVETPALGGTLVEGVVGTPRFVNPLLAAGEPDQDLSVLIFSGLMGFDENGALLPHLAEKYQISEDGLSYTFTLREKLTWHDGQPLTSTDVVETVRLVQNPNLKSPRFGSWDGIEAEALDEKTVRFILRQPNPQFLQQATLGIIPWHLWSTEPIETLAFSEKNLLAVGSGPFRLEKINWTTKTPAVPTSYELESFANFALGRPKIKKMEIRFFANETELAAALENGEVEALAGPDPAQAAAWAAAGRPIITATQSRIFGVFFNQNRMPLFIRPEIRRALDLGVDRTTIIQTVLHDFGVAIIGPRPSDTLNDKVAREGDQTETQETAQNILEEAGWKINEESGIREKKNKDGKIEELKFSLATGNTTELRRTAELLRTDWQKLGAEVEILIFDRGDLDLNVIRPREYDALLFGLALGPDNDLYPFWHSSQRLDPGSNLAIYANLKTDDLLTRARQTQEVVVRHALYDEAAKIIMEEKPAIFIYAPEFIYLPAPEVKNITLQTINSPSDRFRAINRWYLKTEKVWPKFKDDSYN